MSLRYDILFLLLTFSGTLLTNYVVIPSAIKDKPASLHQLYVLDARKGGDLDRFVDQGDGAPALDPGNLAFFSPSQTQILGLKSRTREKTKHSANGARRFQQQFKGG